MKPDAPVLLEAFHYQFHPAWQTFLRLFDAKDVEEARVVNSLFAGMFPKDDIRFNYSLSGGTLMDFGSYAVSVVRSVFADEPKEILSATYRPLPPRFDSQCDEAIFAEYLFPNGGIAKISADLQARGGYWFPALTKNLPSFNNMLPTLTVKLRAQTTDRGGELEESTQTSIIFHNYMGPHLYHRMDIITTVQLKNRVDGKVIKTEKKIEYKKVYNWPTTSETLKGDESFSTYRFQLEEFVNRIKKRQGSGVWVEPEESIRQMEMIDATYLKTGLPLRPTSAALERIE